MVIMEEAFTYTNTPVAPGDFYKKFNELRSDVIQQDWTKDKKMVSPGMYYDYLSADKVKQKMSPIFTRHGLEYTLSVDEPKLLDPLGQKGLQHWLSSVNVTYIDIETGYMTPVRKFWGEGSDVLDKGMKKSVTEAIKQWLMCDFLIAEGIDTEVASAGEAYRAVEKNEVEVKSALEEARVKPKTAKKTEEPVPAEAPKPAEVPAPAEEPKETPKKAPRAKKEDKAEETPAAEPEGPKTPVSEAPKPASGTDFKLSESQIRTVQAAFDAWTEAHDMKRVTDEAYAAAVEAYRGISCAKDIIKFVGSRKQIPQESA